MQLTALFTASILAISASAAAVPQTSNAECLMSIFQRWRISVADCRSAIAEINSRPKTVACDEVWRSTFDYASVGTCKVVVEKKGDPQCTATDKVVQGVEKNLAKCHSPDGKWVQDSSFDFGDGVKVRVTGTDAANDGPQKA